jgi:hypothetical protein
MANKIHFRRCHMCGALNHADADLVQRCQNCDKHLAPFVYSDERLYLNQKPETFDKNSTLQGTPAGPPQWIKQRDSILPYEEYPPLIGLTVYWQ